MILDEKIARGGVIVLDGATGTEIERLGGKMDSAAWCGVANMNYPEKVRQVHEAYMRAGADVITTNTFATCRHVLAGAGLDNDTVAINQQAVTLARNARDAVAPSRPVAIAGSMSNTVAWQPGFISPDPRFIPTERQEIANYREMANTLADAGVDLLILEMMLDIEHASRALEAAVGTGLPVWVGISCSLENDGAVVGWDLATQGRITADHTPPLPLPLDEIIDTLQKIGGDVFGIMHSTVGATTPGLQVLCERWAGPVMAYPETMRGDQPPVDQADRLPTPSFLDVGDLSPKIFAEACRGWVDQGVQIIGGCCGTTIEHMQAMIGRLPAQVGDRLPVG
jgi:methionine synthase I (cobalamin-dependent)